MNILETVLSLQWNFPHLERRPLYWEGASYPIRGAICNALLALCRHLPLRYHLHAECCVPIYTQIWHRIEYCNNEITASLCSPLNMSGTKHDGKLNKPAIFILVTSGQSTGRQEGSVWSSLQPARSESIPPTGYVCDFDMGPSNKRPCWGPKWTIMHRRSAVLALKSAIFRAQ